MKKIILLFLVSTLFLSCATTSPSETSRGRSPVLHNRHMESP